MTKKNPDQKPSTSSLELKPPLKDFLAEIYARSVTVKVLFDLKQLSDDEKHLLALIEDCYNAYLDRLTRWVDKMTDEDADHLFGRLTATVRRGAEPPRLNAVASASGPHFQSSSSKRLAAGATGFLILIQQSLRPDRYGVPRRFDTIPSQPSAQACS